MADRLLLSVDAIGLRCGIIVNCLLTNASLRLSSTTSKHNSAELGNDRAITIPIVQDKR